MSKKGGSAPQAPNPSAQIAAQSAANKEAVEASAKVNAIDINNPYGSTTYTKDDNGLPTAQTTTLTPIGQEIFDSQQQSSLDLSNLAQNRISQVPTDQFSTDSLPYDPRGYNDPLTQKWQGVNAPYNPDGSNYQQDSADMRASSNYAFGQGVDAAGRAVDTYGQAQAADNIGQQFQSNEANYNQATDSLNFDPNTYGGDLEKYRGDVQDAFFDRQNSMLSPIQDQQRQQLEQSLANKGIAVGTEAYNNAINNLGRQQFDQTQRIANDAVLAGGSEAARQLGMEQSLNTNAFNQASQRAAYALNSDKAGLQAQNQGFTQRNLANQQAFGVAQQANQSLGADVLQRTGFEQGLRGSVRSEALQDHQQQNNEQLQRVQAEQQLRNTALQEDLLNRTQAFNEASALIQGAPALGVPQAPSTPNYNIAPVDAAGINQASYNSQVNAYNSQQQRQANMFNTGLGVAGSALSKCHSKYKTDINEDVGGVLRTMRQMKVKTWRYSPDQPDLFDGEVHVSPMAEDWHRKTGLGDGDTIHFGDYVGLLHKAFQELADKVDDMESKLKAPIEAAQHRMFA